MDWFSLSLLCAFSLATADALTKKYLTDYEARELLLIRFVVPGILLIPVLILYPLPQLTPAFLGWIAFLVPLEMIAMLLYMQAIRDAPLYQTLPYLAFTPVFNILTGWLILDEKVSLLGAIGILFVVAGAYWLNLNEMKHGRWQQWIEPLRAIVYRQGSRRMLLVAAIYSLTSVGGKAAMQYVGPQSFGAFYFVVMGVSTAILVGVTRPQSMRVMLRKPFAHLLIGGLMALMVVTHFIAISMVEAAYMVAVKRISLIFGVLYGAWFFHEQGIIKNLASSALMVLGVSLILLA